MSLLDQEEKRNHPRILIFTPYYLPGQKGGGPIQSVKNLVDHCGDSYDFFIVTGDRDLGSDSPYQGLAVNQWIQVGHAKVYYSDLSKMTLNALRKLIVEAQIDVIYLNSFFSKQFTIWPLLLRKLGRINVKKVIVAPRGEFSMGALRLKSAKKMAYIHFVKRIGLYKGILWHATAESEKTDIIRTIGDDVSISVAANLTKDYSRIAYTKKIAKNSGEIKIIFLSRIHQKKNLLAALRFISNLKGKVEFNVYGPIEDERYWKECMNFIMQLPPNVNVEYRGVVDNKAVMKVFHENHIFLFPTLGENFGHVISEALVGACPVVVSDLTPWRELSSRKAGADIELSNVGHFVNVLQSFVDMSLEEYEDWAYHAFLHGKEQSNSAVDILNTLQLFT